MHSGERISEYWDRRLERWRAHYEGRGNVAIVDLMRAGMPAPRPHERGTLLDGEILETDAMVRALAGPERQLLLDYYPKQPRKIGAIARRFEVQLSTLYAWVRKIHGKLQAMLDERRRGPRAEAATKAERVTLETGRRPRAIAHVAPRD